MQEIRDYETGIYLSVPKRMDKVKEEEKNGKQGALKAARNFCGLLSFSPVTTEFGLRLRITRRGVEEGAGGKTAEPGSAFTRTNKSRRRHLTSHATCGGRRVNRAPDSRALPGPHSRGR